MKRFAVARWWLCALVILVGASVPVAAQDAAGELAEFPKLNPATDWPWWRGPTRNGIAAETPVPTKLSETDHMLWKVPVPGRGHASPIVVGDRVFLATADEKQQIHSVLAFDRGTGQPLWKTDVNQGGFPAKNHPKNTEASATVACDGDRLFATFYAHDAVLAVALDLDGKVLWKEDVCRFRPTMYEYGYAPSPLIYKNTVIIAAEYDGPSFLIALDRATGKKVWEAPRRNSISFSSPVVTRAGGREQLLISGHEEVAAFDPASGKRLWGVLGTTHATCGTMVWDGDMVFASGGYPKAETVGVKSDGSKLVWKNNQKCYEQSLLAFDGHVYGLTDGGVLFCWRGSDGREMWKHRLVGPVSASPVLAGGHIYQANERGTLYVFKPNPQKFDLVAENQVGNDAFPSPAICGGQIFLRVAQRTDNERQEFLYCFGK